MSFLNGNGKGNSEKKMTTWQKMIDKASGDMNRTVNMLTKSICDYESISSTNHVVDSISRTSDMMKGSMDNVAEAIHGNADATETFAERINESIRSMSDAIYASVMAANNIAGAIDKGANALSRIADAYNKIEDRNRKEKNNGRNDKREKDEHQS